MATTYPDVIPMIAYEDGPAAMDWLSSAFGFTERTRMLGQDGRLSHGEMQAGDGVVMLASPTPDYQAPRHHRDTCQPAKRWSAVCMRCCVARRARPRRSAGSPCARVAASASPRAPRTSTRR